MQRGSRQRGGPAGLAIRRPVGTLAIASVVVVLGLFFVERLPVDLLPNIEYPHLRVTVNYPGTAPEVMEDQVTRVLEQNLAATENLERIYSRASEGRTNVNLLFNYGTNLDLALQDASRHLELARTQLPSDIEPPRLYKFDPSQDPVWQAGFSSPVRSEVEVRDWVEHELTPQLLALEGASGVEAAGGMVREMEVILDQQRLASYDLVLRDVLDRVAAGNVDMAAGWLTSETFDVMAKTDALFGSAEEIGETRLSLPGSDGRRIPLSEVANVRDGHREQRLWTRLNGTPASQVSVFKLPEANTVDVVDDVQSTMASLERSGFIPEDIEYEAVRDPAYFIRGAIQAVGTAAAIGGLLAMAVVFVFLGSLRKSFVIGLSIPIAILATFAMMGMGGLTLNVISLGGLALGVGLLLDNAIVMLENIYRHREALRRPPDDAAREGAREVVSAITAGTMTNLAAVLPFLLVTGIAALIFREMILTIAFAMLATLAVALTLVPMLAAQLARVRFASGLDRSMPLRAFNRGLGWLRGRYRRLLPRVLRWRWGVIAAAVLAFFGAVQVTGDLGQEFLPQVDDGNVFVHISLAPGTPPQATDEAKRQAEAVIDEMSHVESVFTMVGGHLGGGIINERPGTARSTVQLTSASERPQMSAGEWVDELQQRLAALDLPGATITVRPPSIDGLQFTLTGDDLSIGVVGEDIREMRRHARELAGQLQGIEGLEGVELAREDESPLMRVRVDRERAADLGLDVTEVGESLRAAVDGEVVTQFRSRNREYDVRVRLPRDQVRDQDTLSSLLLFREEGRPVQLGDVAEFHLGEGPAHIERENQSRIVRVNGTINTRVTDTGTVMSAVDERIAGFDLPDDYTLLIGGEWETIQETREELGLVITLAIFLVFVVLAVQYERLSNPLVILAAAPLALIGVVGMLALTATPLSTPVMVGTILLIGIVVNNAILLVEYIELGRRERGLGTVRAIVAAGTIRLRPILMTTLTTVLGMTPLALGLGEGTEIMRPLALSVAGGLLVAMVLTLFVVPGLYLIVSRAGEAMHRWLVGSGATSARASSG